MAIREVRTHQGSCCGCHSAFDVHGCHATNQLNHPLDAFALGVYMELSRVLLVNASRGWFNNNIPIGRLETNIRKCFRGSAKSNYYLIGGKITVNDIMRNCGEVLQDVFEIIMKPACSLLRLEYWIRTL